MSGKLDKRSCQNIECVLWFKNNICKYLLNGRATFFHCLFMPVSLHSFKCQRIFTASQLTDLYLIYNDQILFSEQHSLFSPKYSSCYGRWLEKIKYSLLMTGWILPTAGVSSPQHISHTRVLCQQRVLKRWMVRTVLCLWINLKEFFDFV